MYQYSPVSDPSSSVISVRSLGRNTRVCLGDSHTNAPVRSLSTPVTHRHKLTA
ncbi:hypothetical protein [Nostoc sp.]|uniref:hypothetical protein n=1 Tax=Nostoc sp. TaxID=1180 RepID=UPI002FF6E4F6